MTYSLRKARTFYP